MLTSVGKKQISAAMMIFGAIAVAEEQHQDRRHRDDRDRVDEHRDRIEGPLRRGLWTKQTAIRMADEIAADEAGERLDQASARSWSSSMPPCVAKTLQHRDRARRDVGRHAEEPDDELPERRRGRSPAGSASGTRAQPQSAASAPSRRGSALPGSADGAHQQLSRSARRCAVTLMNSSVSRIGELARIGQVDRMNSRTRPGWAASTSMCCRGTPLREWNG